MAPGLWANSEPTAITLANWLQLTYIAYIHKGTNFTFHEVTDDNIFGTLRGNVNIAQHFNVFSTTGTPVINLNATTLANYLQVGDWVFLLTTSDKIINDNPVQELRMLKFKYGFDVDLVEDFERANLVLKFGFIGVKASDSVALVG